MELINLMYINHITLSTGHLARTQRADVTDATIKTLRPWLKSAIESEDPYPLPGELGSRQGFAMSASVDRAGLICHVGHQDAGQLVTFGVATRSRQSAELWAWLCAQYGSAEALTAPGTPWCAVALHPGLLMRPDAGAWLGDFERCIAWTWLEKKS